MQLSTKVKGIVTHYKMLETQISQVSQHQSFSSVPPGQSEQNTKGHLNDIIVLSNEHVDKLKKEEVMVKEKFRKIIDKFKK